MRSSLQKLLMIGALGGIQTGCFVSGKNGVRNINTAPQDLSSTEDVIQGAMAFGGVSSAFLDKSSVDRMIYRGIPDIRACYEEEARCKRNAPEGKIVVRFTITPEGDIINVGIAESTINSTEMETCLIQVFQGFEYRNSTGATFVLSYPFIFQAAPEETKTMSRLNQ